MALTIGICGLGLILGGLVGWSSRPDVTQPSSTAPRIPATAAEIQVHVAGFVADPGVVTVPEGAIVADAIEAAGGFLATADPAAVNLAATVTGGQQVVVPGRGGGDGGATSGSGGGLISLNLAGATELQELPGVGPVLAERIVAYREAHGPFESVEGLLQVPGIGEAKLGSIRDLVQP